MKKNIARLGIEPQNCKMSWFETWCLSPLDHEISIKNLLIYQYIDRGKTSKKPPKCPNLLPSSLVPAIFYNTSIIYQRVNIHLMERKALVMVVQPTIKNMVQEEVSQMGFKNPCFRLAMKMIL